MKRIMLAILAATMVAMPIATVHADTFTSAELANAAKVIFEVPATNKAMHDYIPRIMTWLNTIGAGLYLPLAGGTMTGAIVFAPTGALTNALDLTDTDIVNALSAAANDLIGTNWTIAGATGKLSLDGGIDRKTAGALVLGGSTSTSVDVSATGETTTVKGPLNCDEAVTFDTSLGVTGATTLSGGATVNTATATDDQVTYQVTAGGAGRFTATISPLDLTANRALRYPDSSGTFALSGESPAIVSPSVIGDIVTFSGITGAQQDSGVLISNVPTMAAASAGAKKVCRSGGADKSLVADGPDYDLLPTMASVAAGSGNLIQSAGADRTQSDSSIVAANVVTESSAASGADQIVTSAGATKVVKDSGVAIGNVPTQAAAAGAANYVLVSGGADKTHVATTLDYQNLPTMAAAASGAGLVCVSGGADKSIASTGPTAANLPTMAAAASGANLALISGGADKTVVAGRVTLTQPATASTITVADGKTLTASNTLTFTGTDSSSVAFGTGGTVAYTGTVCGAATASTTIGTVSYARIGSSDGTIAITGDSTRTGSLHIEITVTGEADAACRFQWQFGTEGLNGADLACSTTGTAIAPGLTVTFANGAGGGSDSFEDGDIATSAISLSGTINSRCGILTANLTTEEGGKNDSVTILNSSITAKSVPIVGAAAPGTATTGQILVTSWTAGAGYLVIDLVSVDGACNGTMKIPFSIPGDTP